MLKFTTQTFSVKNLINLSPNTKKLHPPIITNLNSYKIHAIIELLKTKSFRRTLSQFLRRSKEVTLYIDVGSSTVKVYSANKRGVKLHETKSLPFKQKIDYNLGLSETVKKQLIDYINAVKNKYQDDRIKVFATAVFRKLSIKARRELINDFFEQTGLLLVIVDHDLEGFYLEKALSSEYTPGTPLLLINIGGGSTELAIKEHGQITERYNLEVGVGAVLQDFPFLNEQFSHHSLRKVVDSVKQKIPTPKTKTPVAIYNGGELTYMKLVDYKLRPNKIFADLDHPNVITIEDFADKNQEVYEKISISKLEGLMPSDPMWMHGARACSAIAQAVAEQFAVKNIIPSDSNMIHGTAKQEYRSVVLSGSFRKHLDYILEIKQTLASRGVKILSPRFENPKNPHDDFVIFSGEEGMSPLELEHYHLNMIDNCDALIVCSPHGYVGVSALVEIGYAQSIGKRTIFTEKPKEFILQTLPAEFGL